MKLEELIEKFKPRFWELIDETEKENKEHGCLICEKNGKYEIKEIQEGEATSVSSKYVGKYISEDGWIEVGNFHTHPPPSEMREKVELGLRDAIASVGKEDKYFILDSKDSKGNKFLDCFVFEVDEEDCKKLRLMACFYFFSALCYEDSRGQNILENEEEFSKGLEQQPDKLQEWREDVQKWFQNSEGDAGEIYLALCTLAMGIKKIEEMVEKDLLHCYRFVEDGEVIQIDFFIQEGIRLSTVEVDEGVKTAADSWALA